MSFLSISISLSYHLARNTVSMSGLVLIPATCVCYINYRNRYVRLLVPLHTKTTNKLKPPWTSLNYLEPPLTRSTPQQTDPPKKQEIHRKKMYMLYYYPYRVSQMGSTGGGGGDNLDKMTKNCMKIRRIPPSPHTRGNHA